MKKNWEEGTAVLYRRIPSNTYRSNEENTKSPLGKHNSNNHVDKIHQ